MEWQPQDEPLRQLACCLRDSLHPHNRAAQKQAEQVGFTLLFRSPVFRIGGLLSCLAYTFQRARYM
jgi:hypothetical protein